MPDLPIRFQAAEVAILLHPPASLPSVERALFDNVPFPPEAFADGESIPLGAIKASAAQKFKLDRLTFAVGGKIGAGFGVYRSSGNLFDELKDEGLSESVVGRLNFLDEGTKDLYAVRWAYEAQAAASGSVALGVGVNFGASARSEGLFAVLRALDRNGRSRDQISETLKSWKMPLQRAAADE